MQTYRIQTDAQRALHDLVGLIPASDRNGARDDIATLERALAVLSEALSFRATVAAHAERLSNAAECAGNDYFQVV